MNFNDKDFMERMKTGNFTQADINAIIMAALQQNGLTPEALAANGGTINNINYNMPRQDSSSESEEEVDEFAEYMSKRNDCWNTELTKQDIRLFCYCLLSYNKSKINEVSKEKVPPNLDALRHYDLVKICNRMDCNNCINFLLGNHEGYYTNIIIMENDSNYRNNTFLFKKNCGEKFKVFGPNKKNYTMKKEDYTMFYDAYIREYESSYHQRRSLFLVKKGSH